MLNILRWVVLTGILALSLLVATSIAAHADGGAPNLAYTIGSAQGISVIDIQAQKVTRTITAGGTLQMVQLSLDGSSLYIAQPQQGQVTVLAANSGNEICHVAVPGQPSLLAIDNGANTLFVAGNGASIVTAIDPTTCKSKLTFHASGPVYGIAVAAVGSSLSGDTGNQLWVSAGNTLTTFDDFNGKLVGSVDIPGSPRYISIPPGATVYVTTQSGTVQAVDLTTRKVSQLITGGSYGPMDYDANTGEVYVPDQIHDQIVVLTPANSGFTLPKEPSHVFSFKSKPASVAITSDGQLAFAALANGSVVMLDIPGRSVVTTFQVGGNPQFIITGLYPPAIPQTSPWSTVLMVGAYVLVVALLIVPILLFRRYARSNNKNEDAKYK